MQDDMTLVVGAALGALVFFCPSILRLFWLWLERRRGVVYQGEDLKTGIRIHAVSSLVSPGLPALMIYGWSQCTGGCANGVELLPFIPVAWALFFWGNRRLRRAKAVG